MVQPLIPKIAIVVKKLVQSDESKAVVVMEIWEELLETEISLLVPHFKGI
jgi:importin-4